MGNGVDGRPPGAAPLALFLRVRTHAESFRLLAEAEATIPHPRSATASAALVAAAQGLHGALMVEASVAWRAAVCTASGIGMRRRQRQITRTRHAGTSHGHTGELHAGEAGIETIFPGLLKCWKLQRVAARCALLTARLCLEEAVGTAAGAMIGDDSADPSTSVMQAYTRACYWLLDSGETVLECCTRLGDVSARVLEAATATPFPNKVGAESVWVEGGDGTAKAPETASVDDHCDGGSDARSTVSTAGPCPLDLQEALLEALYDTYLPRALGVGGYVIPPPLTPAGGTDGVTSLDGVLSGFLGYLHARDMRRVSLAQALTNDEVAEKRSPSLAMVVVCANRTPWMACPGALSQAVRALDEQDRALIESASFVCSSTSSTKSKSSAVSAPKVSPTNAPRRPSGDSCHTKLGRHRGRERNGFTLRDIAHGGDRREGGTSYPASPARAWIAVARAVLAGYVEAAEDGAAKDLSQSSPSMAAPVDLAVVANDAILELACEKHPALVAAPRGGPGALARALLAEDRTRPLVLALVHLSSCTTWDGAGGDTLDRGRCVSLA